MLISSLPRATIRRSPLCNTRSPLLRPKCRPGRLQTSRPAPLSRHVARSLVQETPEDEPLPETPAPPEDDPAEAPSSVAPQKPFHSQYQKSPLVRELTASIKRQRMAQANYLFQQVKEEELNQGLYFQMIKGYLKQGRTADCWRYFEASRSRGDEPTVAMYSTMMKCCAIGKDPGSAKKLWQEIEDRHDLVGDQVLYNSYMHVFAKDGEMSKAFELLKEMKEKGIAADIVTYNTLLGGITRQSHASFVALKGEADALVVEMSESGLEMDVRTYIMLAKMALRRDDGHKALRYVDEVIQKNLPLASVDCEVFVKAFAASHPRVETEKVLDRCWKLFLHCERQNGPATWSLISTVLKLFVSYEKWNNAFAMLNLVESRNYRVTREMYEILLSGLARAQRMGKEAVVTLRILLDEMQDLEYTLNLEMYTAVIKIFLKTRLADDAKFYLEKMKAEGFVPTLAIYNQLMKYYSDARSVSDWQGASEEAMELWKDMRNQNVTMNIATYEQLIMILAKGNQVMHLERLLAEMKVRNVIIPIVGYNAVLNMYVRAGDSNAVESAWDLFEGIKKSGIPVNVMTFNEMIEICGLGGDLTGALKLLKDMKDINVAPNTRTYRTLMQLAGAVGNLTLTFDLFNEMLTNGLDVDSACYSALIGACGKAGEIDKVLEVHEDMKRRSVSLNVTLFCDSVTAAADCNRPDLIYRFYDEFLHRKKPMTHEAYALLSDALRRSGDEEGAAAVLELEKEEDRKRSKLQKVAG